MQKNERETFTFARFRFGVDGAALLRGAAAFNAEWEENPKKYLRDEAHAPFVEKRIDGVFVAAFVDSFLVYITDLLTLIFAKKPEMIPKGLMEQRLVWDFDNVDDLRWSVIEKTVHELSYKSFADLEEYLNQKHGFRISSGLMNFARLNYIFECRNSVVHNRGLFSAVSDKRLKANGRLRDELIPSFVGTNALAYLIACADEIDLRVAKKFGLSRLNYAEHFKAITEVREEIESIKSKGKRRKVA